MLREIQLGNMSMVINLTVCVAENVDLGKLVLHLEEDAERYTELLNGLSDDTKEKVLEIANQYGLWPLLETEAFNSYSPKFMAIMGLMQIVVNKELCSSLEVIDRDFNELVTSAKQYQLKENSSFITVSNTEGMIRTAMRYELRRQKLLGEDVSELESTLEERIADKVNERKLVILFKLLSMVNQSYHHPHLLSR